MPFEAHPTSALAYVCRAIDGATTQEWLLLFLTCMYAALTLHLVLIRIESNRINHSFILYLSYADACFLVHRYHRMLDLRTFQNMVADRTIPPEGEGDGRSFVTIRFGPE